jgi:MFS transporter, SP family, general alpha glucoside:H+ symporter
MSFKLFVCLQVVSVFGNICSWFLIDRVGRRNLTLWGTMLLTVILLLCGGLAAAGTTKSIKACIAFMIVYGWFYNITIGSTAYTLLTEVATSRLRVKTISIGIACQSAWYTMWSFTLPYLFNPNKANLGAKVHLPLTLPIILPTGILTHSAQVAFIFGGLSVICCVYLWFYQPETAGRTYEELDELFTKRIPARKFKGYVTEAESKGQEAKRRESIASLSRLT